MAETRKHGYVRVSSKEQNEARQISALKEQGISDRDIFTDKVSGKSFDRPEYQRMLNAIRKGDTLIILSIDRLGRDYSEVQEQWRHITQEIGAHIKVLDMPLLDTSVDTNSLDNKFIADLVLQILSYVAQKERENTRQRQRQGIDAMPIVDGKRVSSKTGRPVGKPKVERPEKWLEVYTEWKAERITARSAMAILGLKPNTFYNFVKEDQTREMKMNSDSMNIRKLNISVRSYNLLLRRGITEVERLLKMSDNELKDLFKGQESSCEVVEAINLLREVGEEKYSEHRQMQIMKFHNDSLNG
jgi:DNA invertase Pin-like site-specific DNA recombinase